jgi:MFS family permease
MSVGQAQCDRTAVHARAEPVGATHPRLVLAARILASSLAFVDGSVVNVALPAIGQALGAPVGGLQWVVNGYLLPLSALLRLGGAAGDRWGRRPLLLVGILVFGITSLGCALASGLPTLIVARFVQSSASGLNSAVARTGGLVATALIGPVVATAGSALVGAFHTAALCAAASRLAGALAAFLMVGRLSPTHEPGASR